MARKTYVLLGSLYMVSLLLKAPTFADPHHHDGHSHSKTVPEQGHRDNHDEPHHLVNAQTEMHKHDHNVHPHHGGQSGTHAHPWWEPPPPKYAGKRSTRWTDASAIARGKQLFQTNCMVCHGADGRGTGPAAKSLPHPPADLTNHFHNKPGDGDGYLFWRVSEGGQVEPFKSMQSAMPPFKTVLSEDQRWDVLAYVHNEFHHGFKSETMATSDKAIPSSVVGNGKVIAVTAASEQIVIDHAAIKGFMDAMIMGYRVNPPSLLDGLQAGDRVRFTVDTQQKAIVKIDKLNN